MDATQLTELLNITGDVNLAVAGVGALVIYGLVSEIRKPFPDAIKKYSFFLNLIIGIIFGYFNLFGIGGLEAGIMASLASTGANAYLNKAKSSNSPQLPVGD